MALVDVIRNTVPRETRRKVGLAVMEQASKYRFTLYPYLWLMHGNWPKGLRLDGSHIIYDHLGHLIKAPRNGVGIFLEIFQDEVYEEVFSPKEGDIVIDVGAYVGMFTIKSALTVGEKGKVIAVEPEPRHLEYLTENCGEISNILPIGEALSDWTGMGKLYLSPIPGCQSLVYQQEEYTMVKINTMDNLVKELNLPKVDFIKIDAEGAELEVLVGAQETLVSNIDLKLSIASYHTSPRGDPEQPQIAKFLEGHGFKVITKKGLRGYTYAEKP